MAHVIILGGSVGGARLAQQLGGQDSLDVVLVDASDYMDHAQANVRAVVDPEWAEFSAIPYADFLPAHVRHVKAKADLANSPRDAVLLTYDGCAATMTYDFLVHATEREYDVIKATRSMTMRKREFESVARAIAQVSSVAIVGAGVRGVELAGEIYAAYGRTKTIHLITSERDILADVPSKLRSRMHEQLNSAGVVVHYGEDPTNATGEFVSRGPLQLASGNIDVGIVLWTTGSEIVGSHRTFAVDAQLRVSEHVFAMGQAAKVTEPRTLEAALLQANYLTKQIVALAGGMAFRQPYKRLSPDARAVSFGPRGGAASLAIGTFGSIVAKMVKSHDLLLGKVYPMSLRHRLKRLPRPPRMVKVC